MGRPSKCTPEILEEICERLAGDRGKVEDLAVICRDEHMPNRGTVRDWRKTDKAVDDRILQAYRDGDDLLEAECITIADTPELGVIEEYERQAKPRAEGAPADAPIEYELVLVKRRQEDMLGHRKLQVYARDQRLVRRYGAKHLHGNLDGSNLPPTSITVELVTAKGK